MAHQHQPAAAAPYLEELIARGKVSSIPHRMTAETLPLQMSYDRFVTSIRDMLRCAYCECPAVYERYPGSNDESIQELINDDTSALADLAGLVTFNRLRTVAESRARALRTTHYTHRAPVNMRTEFPTWLCSIIQSLGIIWVEDGPTDLCLLPVPPLAAVANYGRGANPPVRDRSAARLMNVLRAGNVPISTVDLSNHNGAFWPTIEVVNINGIYELIAPYHHSHYTNEDVCMSLLSTYREIFTPITFTAAQVQINDVAQGLTNNVPANLPANHAADSDPSSRLGNFSANFFGLTPAAAPLPGAQAQPASAWIIGRTSDQRYFCYSIARRLTVQDRNIIFAQKLRAPNA